MVGSYTSVVGSYTPARKIQSTTIIKTQVNICEEQLGTMELLCCVVSKAEILASYITLHLWNIIVIYTLPRLPVITMISHS